MQKKLPGRVLARLLAIEELRSVQGRETTENEVGVTQGPIRRDISDTNSGDEIQV